MKRFILLIIVVTMLVGCSPRFKPGVDLSHEVFRDISISYTDLQNINFGSSTFDNVDLSNDNLSNANFKGAHIENSNFGSAVLENADFSHGFTPTNIYESNFQSADLKGVDFSEAYLRGVDLSGANLTNANLSNAYLEGVDLSGANLTNAYLSNAYLGGVDLSDANLSGVDLSAAQFYGCKLQGASLSGADLSETTFEYCDLTLDMVISASNFTDEPMIRSLFGNVCCGEKWSNAAAYNQTAISPVIMLSIDDEWDSENFDSLYLYISNVTWAVPESWVTTDLQLIELVICIRNVDKRLVETCKYENGPDISRFQPEYSVSIIQTLTGEKLASETFLGTLPRECKSTESMHRTQINGGVDYDSIIEWMTQFVEP